SLAFRRYWEPVRDEGPVDWADVETLQGEFEARFADAVERGLENGQSAIFLSGGLDSISVATLATDLPRQSGRQPPVALSLGLPDTAGEEREQRGVARSLGLDHEFLPFHDAVPRDHLLAAGLDLARLQPAPLLNAWMPAYAVLTQRATRRGIRTILSG